MFTRNYYKYLCLHYADVEFESVYNYFITNDGTTGATKYGTNNVAFAGGRSPAPKYIIETLNTPKCYDFTQLSSLKTSSNGFMYGTFFGTGNNEETINDYWFSGDVVTGLTFSYTKNDTYSNDFGTATYTRTYTITNNNAEAVTIGEVGLVYEMVYAKASGSSGYVHYGVLIDRTALETPITIPGNGGVGQVTYTIQINMPA